MNLVHKYNKTCTKLKTTWKFQILIGIIKIMLIDNNDSKKINTININFICILYEIISR